MRRPEKLQPTWIDCTTFSQGDKVRTPTTFEYRRGGLRVVVTRHRYLDPEDWGIRVDPPLPGLQITEARRIPNVTTIEEAQREALRMVFEAVSGMAAAWDVCADTAKTSQLEEKT